jgi:hypothetical protein
MFIKYCLQIFADIICEDVNNEQKEEICLDQI